MFCLENYTSPISAFSCKSTATILSAFSCDALSDDFADLADRHEHGCIKMPENTSYEIE